MAGIASAQTSTVDGSQYPLRRASSWRHEQHRDRDRQQSQYPLRRASSWRTNCRMKSSRTARSQYPLRRASSWRSLDQPTNHQFKKSLNTLSGGHPLGGSRLARGLILVVSLNTLSGGHPLGGTPAASQAAPKVPSQYPLRRASSWRPVLVRVGSTHRKVSIPSQAGILLAEPGGA